MSSSLLRELSWGHILGLLLVGSLSAAAIRIVRNVYLHPLSKFPGPWYAAATSLTSAIISWRRVEPQWLLGLTEKYGTDTPIRIAPSMLLFPRPSALKDIYADPACNLKAELYGTGALGPPHLFTTRDGEAHRRLRKALGGTQWSIGHLKKNWESRFDDQIRLFVDKMTELAEREEVVELSDKVAEFAADIMTMVSFTEPWGFVAKGRDERGLLASWRAGLDFFGVAGRWQWFRRRVLADDRLSGYFLPSIDDRRGMGYLYAQADRQVGRREAEMEAEGEAFYMERPDYLQYCLEARDESGAPLTPVQKRAHVTLLIQAGADTTATALGSTLRYLLVQDGGRALAKARQELEAAGRAGKLSEPVAYEEARRHLPYFGACIKEALRLNPPATNLFARLTPVSSSSSSSSSKSAGRGVGSVAAATPKRIDGVLVPPGTEVTTNAYVVQRDPALYAPDPLTYRPERWLEAEAQAAEGEGKGEGERKAAEMEAAQFVFGLGPRVCLGKEIAVMELWKLLPQVVRCFDMELLGAGAYVVAGGVAYNRGLRVRLRRR
ncbi:cytochrome P450 monooxygenase-like protein [Apiospora marii]|uniref:Cytochrome P450 monooxygenase-like protein n=1 Tax=Apiospora marii TaxID=335849 RepID=A0ABR1S3I1_9PEZI